MALEQIFKNVKKASKTLALMTDERCNEILNLVADAIENETVALLKANTQDLSRMDPKDPMYDRLQLTEARLEEIADNMRQVSQLPSPLGHVLKHRVLPNGLDLKRVSVPFGVIGVVYEARPNVTFDVFALCLKSGNASILKCGKDAIDSCQAGVDLIRKVLEQANITPDIVALLPATHEATGEMLQAVGYIDLCIPRGSKRLIDFVRDTAKVPVIETGAGVVHCFFDKEGDATIARDIVFNAKTRRCSVCNTLDCLIIHSKRLADLPEICSTLASREVIIHADERAFNALKGHYPDQLLVPVANDDEWHTEWLSLQMGLKTVDSLEEALDHIDTYGSGHSESIVTENQDNAQKFQTMVDAACVYVNTPTSFTDGAQFGLGAEIGISTQKLGARGPMALEEMTTYKWLIEGHGQIRA
ncbi:MAG: glutamate-5-semialdehyde dehydrogenase [Prevotella sp.]|nr:glutamate-5-semialdehyde dehydrogenase [Prevotella sp.]